MENHDCLWWQISSDIYTWWVFEVYVQLPGNGMEMVYRPRQKPCRDPAPLRVQGPAALSASQPPRRHPADTQPIAPPPPQKKRIEKTFINHLLWYISWIFTFIFTGLTKPILVGFDFPFFEGVDKANGKNWVWDQEIQLRRPLNKRQPDYIYIYIIIYIYIYRYTCKQHGYLKNVFGLPFCMYGISVQVYILYTCNMM